MTDAYDESHQLDMQQVALTRDLPPVLRIRGTGIFGPTGLVGAILPPFSGCFISALPAQKMQQIGAGRH